MAFIGTPLDTRNTFQSLQGKRFNGDGSTTAFTLDVAPSSTLDIEVFVGNVRQDPNSAYTLSGTTLTFTGAPPSGTNNIYVVHQAKAVGTIDVPAGGVAADSLATSVLTGQTDIGADIADADLFLVDDGAGGTLRKTAASRIKTYIGDNTPAFCAYLSADQSISSGTWTKVQFNTEVFDTDSAYDNSSNYRFTVPSGEGGKYVIMADVHGANSNTGATSMNGGIYKNGSLFRQVNNHLTANSILRMHLPLNFIDDASVGDYYEYYANLSGSSTIVEGATGTFGSTFMMYKLIT